MEEHDAMDNRVFDVNGSTEDMLRATIELAFRQAGWKTASGWMVDPKKGFVLYWPIKLPDGVNKFPSELPPEKVTTLVWEWLKSPEAKTIELSGWDINADHDGDNGPGWRVYTEGWGHLGSQWEAFMAITPAFMWYGK